jgi:acyl carrier protein
MLPESAIATRIRTALAQHLKRDPSKIQLQHDLRKDLGLDSLAMIELLFKIEEAFDLEIPNDDLSKITTVGDVVAYVEARVQPAETAPAASAPSVERPSPMVTAPAAPKPSVKRPAPSAKVAKPAAAAKKKASRRA